MIPSLQSDHKQKEKIYHLAFAFSVIFALVFPNLNLVLAAPSDDQDKKIYPSTQAVEQVTFATHMANKLDAKKQAEEKAAKLAAIKAEQAAYRKREAARKAAEAKKAAAKAEAERVAAQKAAAIKAAQERAAAQKAAAQKTATVQQTSYTTTTNSRTTSGSSRGTFRISFYDPAALGSSLGYSGVAANYSVLPRGTRLKITMSNGQVLYRTVNDTGGFAASNPRQLDVAMPNSQIPASGILSATVEVL